MTDQKDLLKRALRAIDDLETRLQRSEARRSEAIAVVGMSCRFPGASSPAELWHLLDSGGDAIRELPVGRWEIARGASPADPAAKRVAGGFIDGLDLFDPAFFGISPREAVTLDPQQRLMLEGVWHALEDAAQPPDALTGSQTGVFVGITTSDYGQLTRGLAQDVYVATGAALNAVSGRVSYVLGLQGPCMAIDSACSSSLVAIHTACQSLRAGDCDLALAGGVNALISPEPFELFSRWGMLAADGRCKTFDARADGFTRGEGCGVLVLKRLSDALADRDRILALLRGSAVNQDGRSSGLSVPNGPAQEKVLRAALRSAGIRAAEVDYVEAHGTGTVLGDPIEVEALSAVYGEERPAERPLVIGSIKTNVGHLESASGVAGLCKTILSLQHEAIPPHLHFHEPNPRIAWGELPLRVPVERTAWPRGERPRRAGVSSFGFTGTNAHVIVEEAPFPPPAVSAAAATAPAHLVVVSARSEASLRGNARSYAVALESAEPAALAALSRGAGVGRSHFPRRAAVVASTPEEAALGLQRAAARGSIPNAEAAPRIAFLFSGQGAQRAGMGRELYEISPRFREALDRCARLCEGRMPVPLLDALFAPSREALRGTAITQPALFALEYALSELWTSWGVRPAAVLGHSLGEYVAACVAGAMEMEDALGLVIERGRLMAELPPGGAMAAVFAPAEALRPRVAERADVLAIAALNGADSTVVSGAHDAVAELCRTLRSEGIECRELEVSHAFHSPLMEPILNRLEALAARVPARTPRIPLAANLDGKIVAAGQVLDGSYWRRHAREPVHFAAGIEAARALGCDTFIEIGPASTLLSLARRVVGDDEVSLLASLGREGEWRTLLQSLGRLYERGAALDWDALTAPYATAAAPLPGYAFERRSFWVDTSRRNAAEAGAVLAGAHPLLGAPQEVAADDLRLWMSEVDLERLPYLADHRVQGSAIVPATAYLELGLAAAAELFGAHPVRLAGVVNEKPLVLRATERRRVQTRLSREEEGRWRFEVHSRDAAAGEGGGWVRHVRGELSTCEAPPAEPAFDPSAIRARCTEHLESAEFYRRLAEKGNEWGPTFQSMAEVWRGEGEALARVHAVDAISGELGSYRFHPALSDSAGHVLVATVPMARSAAATGGALVGGGVDEVRQYAAAVDPELWAHAVVRATEGPENVVTGDVRVYDSTGRLVSETLGARLWFLRESRAEDPAAELFYQVQWQEAAERPTPSTEVPSRWYLLADDSGVADALAPLLERTGGRVTRVRPGPAYRETEHAVYLDPGSDVDWESLLGGAVGPDTIVGFVHLWSLSAHTPEGPGVMEALIRRDLAAVQALARYFSASRARGRLWMATCGAQAVLPEEPTDPGGAALWSFTRALGAEHRELYGGLIDLDPTESAEARASDLADYLLGLTPERAWAARRGTWYVPRLDHAAPPPARLSVQSSDTCLISGGLGGIGLEVAEHLVAGGCRSLVLLGRTLPPAEDGEARWAAVRAALARLQEAGATLRLAAIDVAELEQVEHLAHELAAEGLPPVRGIFHAAGVLHYGPLSELSSEQLAAVLAPKVAGALNLVEVFGSEAERVVFFSSNSAILPSPLMAGYAAGNAFLDALAERLRSRGVAATSINWGTWGEAGMATRFSERESGNVLTALRTLSTAEALEALNRTLAADLARMVVMRMDWTEWQRLYPDFVRDPFFERMVTPVNATRSPSIAVDRAILPLLESQARRALLGDYLARCVGRVLGVDPGELNRRGRITLMGFDSLMALEVKNDIESTLGVITSMVRLLEGPSIEELVDEVDRLLAAGAPDSARGIRASLETLVEGEL